jgi:hypothetical protein
MTALGDDDHLAAAVETAGFTERRGRTQTSKVH